MKMQASLLYEPGRPLEVADLDLEGPKEDEVMVRMVATGVCHSCLHVVDGSWTGFPMPMVLGDEGAGIVEEVGPGVRHVKTRRPCHTILGTGMRTLSLLRNRTIALV